MLEPPGNNLIKQEPWPIEYTGGQTDEVNIGMRAFEGYVARHTAIYRYNATNKDLIKLLIKLDHTKDNKYLRKIEKILGKNPNFTMEVNGKQVAGKDAAAALTGALAKLPGDPQDGHGTAPPGANATPQSATGGRHNTVIITYSDGAEEVRAGGTRTWRNNNPGNIRPGNLEGEIGSAGGFTVFSSEDAGGAAIPALLLRPRYQALTVFGAIATWAPPADNNDTAAYQRRVQDMTGIDGQTRMNTLNADQLQSVVHAIRTVEGWTVGTVTYRRPR